MLNCQNLIEISSKISAIYGVFNYESKKTFLIVPRYYFSTNFNNWGNRSAQ